jgi:hypothetical protein
VLVVCQSYFVLALNQGPVDTFQNTFLHNSFIALQTIQQAA